MLLRRSFLAYSGAVLAPGQPLLPDVLTVPADLVTPPVTGGPPVPGRRVRQTLAGYEGTDVHHALYLPRDWRRDRTYPVIVEYAGNGPFRSRYGDFSPGTVEGSNLGYGISGGKGFIWVCLPFVNTAEKRNELWWWGNVAATVDYATRCVDEVCSAFGGDRRSVVLAGFSRGAIACNYIGLHDDEIAGLWRGFIGYSHYDGVRTWNYPGSDRASALDRLRRLKGRPSFVCQEGSVEATRRYIGQTGITAPFTFVSLPFRNHNDAWVLRNIPERKTLRRWLAALLTP